MRTAALLLCGGLLIWAVVKLVDAIIAVAVRVVRGLAIVGVSLAISIAAVLAVAAVVGATSWLFYRFRTRVRSAQLASRPGTTPKKVRMLPPQKNPGSPHVLPAWASEVTQWPDDDNTAPCQASDPTAHLAPDRIWADHSTHPARRRTVAPAPAPKPVTRNHSARHSVHTPPPARPVPSLPIVTPTDVRLENRRPAVYITLVVEPAEHLPHNIKSTAPVRYVHIRSSDVLAIGHGNKIDSSTTYRIRRVHVHVDDFADNLSRRARSALQELVNDPSDSGANARFRRALPSPQLDTGPTQATMRLHPGADIDLGDCDVKVVDNNQRIPIHSRHIIARGRLPLSSLLRDDARLTSQFARTLGNPTKSQDLRRELRRAVSETDGLTLLRDHRFEPGQVHNSPVKATGHHIDGDYVPTIALGSGTEVDSSEFVDVGRMSDRVSRRIDTIAQNLDLSQYDYHAPPSAEPETPGFTRGRGGLGI